MKSRIAAFMGLALVLAGLAAVACGGSALSDQEYFEAMDQINVRFENLSNEIEEPDLSGAGDEASALNTLRDFMRQTLELFREFIDELRAINAPNDLKDAHETFTNGTEDALLPILESIVDELDQADSFNEAMQAFFGSDLSRLDNPQISQEAIEACETIQARADEIDYDLDMGCDDF